MRKAKPKQTAIIKAEPKEIGKPAESKDYHVGYPVFKEDKDAYIASIQIGKDIKQENITVTFDNKSLEFIVGQREDKKEEDKKRGYYSIESFDFSHHYKIPMPLGVDTGKISYGRGEGVFLIYFPKKENHKQLGPAKRS